MINFVWQQHWKAPEGIHDMINYSKMKIRQQFCLDLWGLIIIQLMLEFWNHIETQVRVIDVRCFSVVSDMFCFYFCFMHKRARGSLIIKPNVATWFIMRWNSFSEDLELEKLFRLDCCLPPLVTVQAHDLNVHLQNTHTSRMQISFVFVLNRLS